MNLKTSVMELVQASKYLGLAIDLLRIILSITEGKTIGEWKTRKIVQESKTVS